MFQSSNKDHVEKARKNANKTEELETNASKLIKQQTKPKLHSSSLSSANGLIKRKEYLQKI